MSRKMWLVLAVLVGVGATYLYFDLRDFLGLTTMGLTTAERTWGEGEFSPGSFRNGSTQERASQVASLVRSKRYIGRGLSLVEAELGAHDRYHNADEIPAYALPDAQGASWTLVFVGDEQGKVSKVMIHKECCYRGILSPFIR